METTEILKCDRTYDCPLEMVKDNCPIRDSNGTCTLKNAIYNAMEDAKRKLDEYEL
jgi:hypothetical protein